MNKLYYLFATPIMSAVFLSLVQSISGFSGFSMRELGDMNPYFSGLLASLYQFDLSGFEFDTGAIKHNLNQASDYIGVILGYGSAYAGVGAIGATIAYVVSTISKIIISFLCLIVALLVGLPFLSGII